MAKLTQQDRAIQEGLAVFNAVAAFCPNNNFPELIDGPYRKSAEWEYAKIGNLLRNTFTTISSAYNEGRQLGLEQGGGNNE